MLEDSEIVELEIDFDVYDNPDFGFVASDLVGDYITKDNWLFFRGKEIKHIDHRIFRFDGQSNQGLPDYFDAHAGWILCSKKLVNIINGIVDENDIQWLTPRVEQESQEKFEGYLLLNVIKRLPCMDMKISEYKLDEDGEVDSINKLVIQLPKKEFKLNLFRLAEFPVMLLGSRKLRELCVENEVTGIYFKDILAHQP